MSLTLDALRADLAAPKATDTLAPDYCAKNMHPLPSGGFLAPSREAWIGTLAKGEIVLHIGASGLLQGLLKDVAAKVYGWDLQPEADDILAVDLDEVGKELPVHPNVSLIVCGEVLEHLGNPRHFLERLRAAYPGVTVVLTVPNAFTVIGFRWMAKGYENVNRDHVAWYSYYTLKGLLDRVGYTLRRYGWYNGGVGTAEGLIAVVE